MSNDKFHWLRSLRCGDEALVYRKTLKSGWVVAMEPVIAASSYYVALKCGKVFYRSTGAQLGESGESGVKYSIREPTEEALKKWRESQRQRQSYSFIKDNIYLLDVDRLEAIEAFVRKALLEKREVKSDD